MADGDLMDLSDVISELGISEQDLQNLVAQGKLKAVRAGRTVKFRRPEVMSMKSGKNTEPTIIIPAQGSAAPANTSFDESAATVVPEEPAGGVVPIDTGTVSLEDEDLEILPLEDEAASTQAEAPIADDEELTVVEEVEEAYEDEDDEEERGSSRRRPSRRSSARKSRRLSEAMYEKQESPLWMGLVVATLVFLLFVGSIFTTVLTKGYTVERGDVVERFVPSFLEGFYEALNDRPPELEDAPEAFLE